MEPISGGSTLLIFALAQMVAARGNQKAQAENATRTIASNEQQQAENRALQRELAESDREHRERLQALEHERAMERQAHSLKAQQQANRHPLSVPAEWLDLDVPEEALRCFIAAPRFLTLNTPQNVLWDDMHGERLDWEIKSFVQNWYGPESPRSLHVYGRDLLNPSGLRGEGAAAVLRLAQPDRQTLWLQADRLDPGYCGLGFATWGMDSVRQFHRLGEVPNYSMACHRSMAAEVALVKQGTEKQQSAVDSPRISDTEVTRQAVDYLSTAYKMLLAASADIHFLSRSAMPPLLPHLIQQRVFDLEDHYIRDATGAVLAGYFTACAKLAAAHPALAPEIWLGMAEATAPLSDNDGAIKMVLEAWRALARLHRQPEPARLDDLPMLIAALPPAAAQPIARQTADLLHKLGQIGIAKALQATPEDAASPENTNQYPERLRRMAGNVSRYFPH